MDWGSAYDYVDAFIKLQKLKKSDNYIIATGKTHKVKDFIKIVYEYLNLDYKKYVVEDRKLLFRNTNYRVEIHQKIKIPVGNQKII